MRKKNKTRRKTGNKVVGVQNRAAQEL